MSWSIEEHIGECRPFPAQVVVYKGETGECLAYVSGEVADRLKAENAKLREVLKLAAFVLETMEHVTSWRFEGDGKVFDSAYFYDYLHELGVTE